MITLYTFNTGNGRKASILLEELGLRYRVQKVDIRNGEQRAPEFLDLNPMGRIPVVVEDMPGGHRQRLFGSGAILLYFANRTGQLMPAEENRRTEALSWLMVGLTDLSPSAGYRVKFSGRFGAPIPEAEALCAADVTRCFTALDQRLSTVAYLAEEYSIADIACYPFVANAMAQAPETAQTYPALKRWHDEVTARPAVQRGMAIPA